MATCILALDQGTTSSRAIVFDAEGTIRGSAQREFEPQFPRPGWVEHDPAEIWSTQAGVITEALGRAHVRPRDIAGVGIANQRETTIVWDRTTGQPIYNAIVWQDRRTARLCDQLRAEGVEPLLRARTGLLLDPYFAGTKIRWILDHVDGARDKAERGELAFGTVDSWLMYKLTSGQLHVTDATNAARSLLYNLQSGDWDDELLRVLQIPRSVLPEVRSSSEVYGEVSTTLAISGAALAGMVGDQHAALAGQLCFQRGMAKNTYGTGCFLLMNTGDQPQSSANRLLSTLAWRRGDRTTFALEGSIFVAGAVVQWLRDGLGLIRTSAEVEPLARSVSDNGGVFMVPAFTGLGAPHWDPYARGTLLGITRGTSRGHLARAALEAIAFQVAELNDAMQRDAQLQIDELRVDGGAAANDLLLQFQADILGVPVVRPTVIETTALGAAYMAGLAVGFWPDVESLARNWQEGARFEPRVSPAAADRLRSRWQDAVERAKGWQPVDED